MKRKKGIFNTLRRHKKAFFIFFIGAVLEAAAITLEYSDTWPFLYRFIAPSYWRVSAAYNKLAQPGRVVPTDDGYEELSKILCSLPEVIKWADPSNKTSERILQKNLKLIIAVQDPQFGRAGVAFYDNVIDFRISYASRKEICLGHCTKTWLKDTIDATRSNWITFWAFVFFILGAMLECYALIDELSEKGNEHTYNLGQFSDDEPRSY